jgi:apolipoprotein N-acyltransferase
MFGEYVPGRNTIPLLKRYPIRDFDFTPGRSRGLLAVQGYPCGALICFEAIFPGPARDEVRRGAQFLVFLTSDAWAGPSSEVLLHADTAPLRAVETGRWVVRSASIGPSEIISPRGEVMAQVAALQSGVAHATIAPRQELTPYVRYGDAPLLIFAALLVVLGLLSRRREAGATGGPRI